MSAADPRHAAALEALCELAAEGGREAAWTVGKLVGRTASIGEVQLVLGPDPAGVARLVGRPDLDLVAVAMELQEPVGGRLLLLVAADEAERVSQTLVPDAAAGSLDAVGESALVEVGNIAGSAFVSAVAGRLGGRILHRVPRLTRGGVPACLAELVGRPTGPAAAARFECPSTPALKGVLLFLPDAAMLRALEAA
jgi:chemotaxis protein CheC